MAYSLDCFLIDIFPFPILYSNIMAYHNAQYIYACSDITILLFKKNNQAKV